ncbi:hypothetical protein T484DRAFT_1966515, partial [Baffinella frigidus]
MVPLLDMANHRGSAETRFVLAVGEGSSDVLPRRRGASNVDSSPRKEASDEGSAPGKGASNEGSEPWKGASDEGAAPWKGASIEGSEACVRLQLDYGVRAGGEVTLNYGVRPADEFLLYYAWAPDAPSAEASVQVLLERLPVVTDAVIAMLPLLPEDASEERALALHTLLATMRTTDITIRARLGTETGEEIAEVPRALVRLYCTMAASQGDGGEGGGRDVLAGQMLAVRVREEVGGQETGAAARGAHARIASSRHPRAAYLL